MRPHYLYGTEPDLDDFFAEMRPLPPPTRVNGGMVFVGPYDAQADVWYGYLRRGDHWDHRQGTLEVVRRWAMAQQVRERWLYDAEQGEYLRV